jgi:hypothetical protein
MAFEDILPDFGANIEEILGIAVDFLNLYDEQRFLWVIAAFSLATLVILWAVRQIQNPPNLDV